MQKFDRKTHKQFIKYFNIKENPTQIELDFLEKTKKYIRFVKWIPGLRMVWIWNSISMNCSSRNSDIDLFIVTTQNSMWFNRIIITIIFQILWVRKNSKNHAWRFCLSFFSTLDWLDFSSWKIENDIYLYFWIVYFKPILDFNNTYSLFINKNKSWADFSEYNNIIEINKTYIKIQNKNKCSSFLLSKRKDSGLSYEIIKFLNNILKKLFLPKTLKSYIKINKPYWIIINDNLLKFHNNDIRKNTAKKIDNN